MQPRDAFATNVAGRSKGAFRTSGAFVSLVGVVLSPELAPFSASQGVGDRATEQRRSEEQHRHCRRDQRRELGDGDLAGQGPALSLLAGEDPGYLRDVAAG